MASVRRVDLWRVFWRGLWLQGSWSYRDMQTLGFAWALEPVLLRRQPRAGEAWCAAAECRLTFFNSNPILAAAILGAAVHAEMDASAAGPAEARRVCGVLMGPYGALGDSFFWAALRPCAVLLALVVAVTGHTWAPWLLVGLFGGLNLAARGWFFAQGVRRGVGVAEAIQNLNLLHKADLLKAMAALLAGAFVVATVPAPRWLALGIPPAAGWGGLVAVTLGVALLVRRGVGPGSLLLAVAAIACAAEWLP